jgi:hypothetical protein
MSDEKEETSGLTCFLSENRVCGADCMAYLTAPPAGKDFQGQQFAHCMVLVNIQRAGKHLVVIANEIGNAPPNHPLPPAVR